MPAQAIPDPAAGVFETVLIYAGSPISLAAHLQRMAASVRELFGAALPADTHRLAVAAAAGLPTGRLRLAVRPLGSGDLETELTTHPVDSRDIFPQWERAIGLGTRLMAGGLGPHKWADRHQLAHEQSKLPEGLLPLLVDRDGSVLEASRANLFVVERERLMTPGADGRILPGTARAQTIALAHSLGLEVIQQPLSVSRVLTAGEAFLTGSIRGIEPVYSLDGVQLRAPSEPACRLASALRRQWLCGSDELAGAGR